MCGGFHVAYKVGHIFSDWHLHENVYVVGRSAYSIEKAGAIFEESLNIGVKCLFVFLADCREAAFGAEYYVV